MIDKKKRASILSVLWMLDAFVMGGCASMLLVNRLLDVQLNFYTPRSMIAAEAILDFTGDLMPYYMACVGILLVLILITLGAWAWRAVGDWLTIEDQAYIAPGSRPPIITNTDR
jgi:protein-S-isoprenylcysteine O-methyltransferase Ste14